MFRLISSIVSIFRLRAVQDAPQAEPVDDAMAHHLREAAQGWMPPTAPTAPNPANALLESADASAGKDAQHAHDLRVAADAWLRVVR